MGNSGKTGKFKRPKTTGGEAKSRKSNVSKG